MENDKKAVEKPTPKQTKLDKSYEVLKPFTLDKKYQSGQTVTNLSKDAEKHLLTNKFIK
jgi:hypothetical protein